MQENELGRVVGVHGFHVRVELDTRHRSPVRASLDGVETQVKINAYVTFEIGAGESVLGIVTDLDARQVFEPDDEELTLELVRPRRLATVQLLGTIRVAPADENGGHKYHFDPGVNILPTLDTPAIPARRDVLAAVLTDAPRRHGTPREKGKERTPSENDGKLLIGEATAAIDKQVFGSYNDLLCRPLAVVGNTGSGKSCTIAHLLQAAMQTQLAKYGKRVNRPRIFILDINGEYASAFPNPIPAGGCQPNCIYVNGKEFGVPVWLMTAYEVCQWLNAAEQVQEPTLKQFWSVAKGATDDKLRGFAMALGFALKACDSLHETVGSNVNYYGQKVKHWAETIEKAIEIAVSIAKEDKNVLLLSERREELHDIVRRNVPDDFKVTPEGEIRLNEFVETLRPRIQSCMNAQQQVFAESADKPLYIGAEILGDPRRLLDAARIEGAESQFGQNLRGLQLRLANRLADKRWGCIQNFDTLGIKKVADWFGGLGIGQEMADEICVIDCSMLAFEVLPYVCGVIGRMLLELREHVAADLRFQEPWVIVLEEAHNYISPRRQDEQRGVGVSRETFERIAKEGRKFGLSLVVASQRPSDISATVLSQCANFIIHRLQNPDDIDHFRKIVPSQSRRLLDQITILRAGEAIVVGSAFHIPSRVQVKLPEPEPSSQSSAPYRAWSPEEPKFDFRAAVDNWLGVADQKTAAKTATPPAPPAAPAQGTASTSEAPPTRATKHSDK